jgi:CheY-like chemotaxis protein
MNKDVLILVAEDDDGHFALIERNLIRSGILNPLLRFHDGQEILDFLEKAKTSDAEQSTVPMILLLDIRMPKVDGLDVLRRVKSDQTLRNLPIVILSTTRDPKAVEQCQRLGCSKYVVKPIEYEKFIEAIQDICRFLHVLEVPALG